MLLNVAASFPNALFVKDFQCDKDCDRGLGSLGRVLGGNQKINKDNLYPVVLANKEMAETHI